MPGHRLADEFAARFEKTRHAAISEKRKLDVLVSDQATVDKELSRVQREIETLVAQDEALNGRHLLAWQRLEDLDVEAQRQIESVSALRAEKQQLLKEIAAVEREKKELEVAIAGESESVEKLNSSAQMLMDKIDVVNAQRLKYVTQLDQHREDCMKDETEIARLGDLLLAMKSTAFNSLCASGVVDVKHIDKLGVLP